MEKYYREFDDKDENKLVYMDIFKEYTVLLETYIVNNLNHQMKGSFQMEIFAEELL